MSDQQPEVYIVGEYHNEPSHGDKEIQLAEAIEPDTVVYEAFSADVPEDRIEDELKQIYETKTLADLQEAYSTYGDDVLSDPPEELLERARSNYESGDADQDKEAASGYIPDTVEEFVSTPIYEFHPAVHEQVIASLGDTIEDEYEKNNEGVASALEAVRNTYLDYHKAQKEDEPGTGVGGSRFMEYLGRKDTDVTVVGADDYMAKRQLDEDQSWRKQRRLNEQRERTMAETIIESVKDADGPVMAVLGKAHALPTSSVIQRLDDEDITYENLDLAEADTYEPDEITAQTLDDGLEAVNDASLDVPASTTEDIRTYDDMGVTEVLADTLQGYVSDIVGGEGHHDTTDISTYLTNRFSDRILDPDAESEADPLLDQQD